MSCIFLSIVDKDMTEVKKLISEDDYPNLDKEKDKIKPNCSMVNRPLILRAWVELENKL